MRNAALRVAGAGFLLAMLGSVSCGPRDDGEWLRDVEEMALVPVGATFVSDQVNAGRFGGDASYGRNYETAQSRATVVSFYDDALTDRSWAVLIDELENTSPPKKAWVKGDLVFVLSLSYVDQTTRPNQFSIKVFKREDI
ncbi:MAG: hypothetical protein ACKVT1_02575 [Dehalococcoidia bacterium]